MARKDRVDPRSGSARPPRQTKEKARGRDTEAEYYGDLYIEDEHTGVSRASLRRSRTFLFVGICGLLCSIIAFILCVVLYQTGITNHQNACWNHELQIEQLAQQYITTNGFTSLPAYVEDIPTFTSVQKECPDGGSYTWNPVTGEYYCSVHQHYPDGYGRAQSVNMGTETTVISDDDATS